MKKLCVLILIHLIVFNTTCFGAVSDDVYVRKDVFDAKMEAFMSEMRNGFEKLNAKIDAQSQLMDERFRGVDEKFRGLEARMESEYRSLDARINDLKNDIYLGLVVLGLIFGLPTIQKVYRGVVESKPSITLEDVRRLIQENNTELQKTQRV